METRNILFNEEEHSYKDEYDNNYISSTQLIGLFEEPFDSRFWAMYRAIDQIAAYKPRPFPEYQQIELSFNGKRRKYHIETLYEGIIPTIKTTDQIVKEWNDLTEDSCAWGNYRHNYLEDCILKFNKSSTNTAKISQISDSDYSYKVSSIDELRKSPLQFTFPTIFNRLKVAIEKGWTLFAEKRIYSPEHLIAGTIDVLLVKGSKFHILDWKTNKKPILFKPGYYKKTWNQSRTKKVPTKKFIKTYDKLISPLNNLYQCKGVLYSLQLSLYARLCELWGLSYNGLTLCHIRPMLDAEGEVMKDSKGFRIEHEPEFYKIKFLKDDINKVLDWRLNNLDAKARA